MAMQLTQTLNTGVSVNYFRIASIRVFRPSNGNEHAIVYVDSFLNQSSRQAGFAPIAGNCYEVPQDNITTALAYVYLMTLPDFAGATQV